MRLLLDTHAFLQFIIGSPNLSTVARRLIEDPRNVRLLSIASIWEIAIKLRLGKLELTQRFENVFPHQIEMNAVSILSIAIPHLAVIATLPFHHRDPFDRMLVAQSMVEGIPLISSDATLDQYAIDRLW
ncbi:MAG: type II toxin-antitoxin system VapC family toxin [Dehalococcoidia bacterium]